MFEITFSSWLDESSAAVDNITHLKKKNITSIFIIIVRVLFDANVTLPLINCTINNFKRQTKVSRLSGRLSSDINEIQGQEVIIDVLNFCTIRSSK